MVSLSGFQTVLPVLSSNKYILRWYALKAECVKLILTKLKGSFTERDSLLLSAMHSHIRYFYLILFQSILLNSSLLYCFLFILFLPLFVMLVLIHQTGFLTQMTHSSKNPSVD